MFDCYQLQTQKDHLEVVRNQKVLTKESKEFELFKKKMRDKTTEQLPSDEEVEVLYNKLAGLRMCYNKVVCISCAAVSNGKLFVKTYSGEEDEIIDSFYKKCKEFEYIVGYNILSYDLPLLEANSLRYDNISDIPDRFSTSGKKPWNMDRVVDLMDVFKGTYFVNPSLDEVCYHLGVDSSKEGGIDGSKVSDVYYKGGLPDIVKYCERDVVATVNVFQKLKRNSIFEDVTYIKVGKEKEEEYTLLEKVLDKGQLDPEDNDKILKYCKGKSKEEREAIKQIILSALQKDDSSIDIDEKKLFEKIDKI